MEILSNTCVFWPRRTPTVRMQTASASKECWRRTMTVFVKCSSTAPPTLLLSSTRWHSKLNSPPAIDTRLSSRSVSLPWSPLWDELLPVAIHLLFTLKLVLYPHKCTYTRTRAPKTPPESCAWLTLHSVYLLLRCSPALRFTTQKLFKRDISWKTGFCLLAWNKGLWCAM